MDQPPSITLHFQFHAGLESLLPTGRRGGPVRVVCAPHQTLKHLAESLGIPHTEIGEIQVGGQPAPLELQAGDCGVQEGRVDVFPPAQAPRPSDGLRFVLDNHLGRLAAYLRMLGCDSLYRNDYQDDVLAEVASREQRILLTRDRRLLMRKSVLYGYCVRHVEPPRQVVEVVRRYGLALNASPFQRCLHCNHPLQPIPKAQVLDRLEPLTKLYYDEFHLCPACNRVYWKGSHYEHMLGMVQSLINQDKS